MWRLGVLTAALALGAPSAASAGSWSDIRTASTGASFAAPALAGADDVIVASPGFGPGTAWMARGTRTPAFGPLTPISPVSTHTRLVLAGPSGDVAVVFTSFDEPVWRPMVSVRPPGGTFSPPEPMPDGAWHDFAIGPAGEVVAAGQSIDPERKTTAPLLAARPRGGHFALVDPPPGRFQPQSGDVAIDAAGGLTLVWKEAQRTGSRPGAGDAVRHVVMTTSRPPGGAFAEPRELAVAQNGDDITLATAPGGHLAVVLPHLTRRGPDDAEGGLLIVERPDGTRRELLLPGAGNVTLAGDAAGRFAVTWVNVARPREVAFAAPGRDPVLVPGVPLTGLAGALAIDELGRPVLAGEGGAGIQTTVLSESGTWCPPELVSLDAHAISPVLAAGPGRGLVTWSIQATTEVRAARYEARPGCSAPAPFAEVTPIARAASSGRAAAIATRCGRAARCRGELVLRARGRRIGRAGLRIPPSGRVLVRVKLSPAGRRWLARSDAGLRATAALRLRGAGNYSRVVELRR